MLLRRLFLCFCLTIPLIHGYIDNGILGDPYVNCGENHIDIHFDTRNTFKGIVFVEDHLGDPECRSAPIEGNADNARNASISLGFKDCGIERRASNDPKGILITTTLVVAFNLEYLTKIDRVYVIQCYYMEMQNKLEKQISVSMAPPSLQTQQVPMPVCRYEVLDGSPEGLPVFYAKIGQMVYHKWTCDAQTDNQFCMKVHSCTVDDGNGDRVELIDADGCAKDRYLLQNLDYISDLMVGKEAHVYKYADRQSMFFDCQITLTVKEPDEQYCDVPQCPDPQRRRRTSHNATIALNLEALRIMPTAAEPEVVKSESEKLPTNFIINNEQTQKMIWIGDHFTISQDSLCMSSFGISSLTAINFILMGASSILFWKAFRVVKSLN